MTWPIPRQSQRPSLIARQTETKTPLPPRSMTPIPR